MNASETRTADKYTVFDNQKLLFHHHVPCIALLVYATMVP